MKQASKESLGLPAYDALTGNDEARAAAAKVKAAIESLDVDKDAPMRAERNDVLDAAIERLSHGRWVTGELFRFGERHRNMSDIDMAKARKGWKQGEIYEDTPQTKAMAAVTRQYGERFCLIGALGAQEGIHSHAAIDEAVTAVAKAVGSTGNGSGYGYTSGSVFGWNDAQTSAAPVIEALHAAKAQPLSKSYK